jgi:hypothetical protein
VKKHTDIESAQDWAALDAIVKDIEQKTMAFDPLKHIFSWTNPAQTGAHIGVSEDGKKLEWREDTFRDFIRKIVLEKLHLDETAEQAEGMKNYERMNWSMRSTLENAVNQRSRVTVFSSLQTHSSNSSRSTPTRISSCAVFYRRSEWMGTSPVLKIRRTLNISTASDTNLPRARTCSV